MKLNRELINTSFEYNKKIFLEAYIKKEKIIKLLNINFKKKIIVIFNINIKFKKYI